MRAKLVNVGKSKDSNWQTLTVWMRRGNARAESAGAWSMNEGLRPPPKSGARRSGSAYAPARARARARSPQPAHGARRSALRLHAGRSRPLRPCRGTTRRGNGLCGRPATARVSASEQENVSPPSAPRPGGTLGACTFAKEKATFRLLFLEPSRTEHREAAAYPPVFMDMMRGHTVQYA